MTIDNSIYEHDIITPSSITILYINESATSASEDREEGDE